MNLEKTKCIVCSAETTIIKELPKEMIGKMLSQRGILDSISELGVVDYKLHKCNECNLEFSQPMQEATSAFYKAIIEKNNGYYPKFRWEWGKITELLQQEIRQNQSTPSLLDVGCGGGDFLDFITKNSNRVNAIGIDSTPHSIEICKSKNIKAICCDLSEFNETNKGRVDIITLWHVLEHVSSPTEIINMAQESLNDNGSLFFSVPLSPASYEILELDPLNLPPHHLTRWSIKSLEKIALVSGMSFNYYTPKPESFIYRVARSLIVISDNSFGEKNKAKKLINLIRLLIKNPSYLFKSVKKQLDYSSRPDLILVRLTKPRLM